MTDLRELQQSWNELARKDAMWAVLTGPLGAGRAWDPDAFFATGADEVQMVLDRVRAAGAALQPGRALDFGCGPGRLSQALTAHFQHVDGVDIAPAMIERARALNRVGDRCAYHLNAASDLRLFPSASFDLVYSSITLQHVEPRFASHYIEEFFRVVKAGGAVVFQLPSEPVPVERPRTRQESALPPESCRATITVPKALRCAPGSTLRLRVMIRNDSSQVWPSSDRHDDTRFAIRLGNHWRSRFGFMRGHDDLRTGLPFDLGPGESVEVGINPVVPATRGIHVLELDMVQEHVRWFAEAGSKTARIRLTVDPSLGPGEVHGLPAVMEMHGIRRQEVEALIARCGGELLAADPDDAPGPGWTSYRYIARRQRGPDQSSSSPIDQNG